MERLRSRSTNRAGPARAEEDSVRIGRRAFRTIKQNLWFTAGYNVIGIALAAGGFLPPIGAAAAQSLPDVAVMLNSSRLLRGAPEFKSKGAGGAS